MKIAGIEHAGDPEILDDDYIRIHFMDSNHANVFIASVVNNSLEYIKVVSEMWGFDKRLLLMTNPKLQLKFIIIIMLKFPIHELDSVLSGLKQFNQQKIQK